MRVSRLAARLSPMCCPGVVALPACPPASALAAPRVPASARSTRACPLGVPAGAGSLRSVRAFNCLLPPRVSPPEKMSGGRPQQHRHSAHVRGLARLLQACLRVSWACSGSFCGKAPGLRLASAYQRPARGTTSI